MAGGSAGPPVVGAGQACKPNKLCASTRGGEDVQIAGLIGGATEVCGGELTLRDAARQMAAGEMGSLGVTAGGKLIGIFTERDLMRAVASGADPETAIVDEWMTSPVDTFSPHVEVEEAALWLLETGYRHLPVVEDDRLLAILSIRDVLGAVVDPDSMN